MSETKDKSSDGQSATGTEDYGLVIESSFRLDDFSSVGDFIDESYHTADKKGWHDEPRTVGELIALCHSELSEALEEYRKDAALPSYFNADKPDKPEGFGIELADCVIRIFDMAKFLKIDLVEALITKSFYNRSRPYRHGGKTI